MTRGPESLDPDTMLSTTEAADVLNVDVAYLLGLIERGELPLKEEAPELRLRVRDVLQFKVARDARRAGALEELADLDREYY